MAAPGVIRSGVGFRHIQIFPLNANGSPNASSTTVYEGTRISGARTLTLNDPEPQQIMILHPLKSKVSILILLGLFSKRLLKTSCLVQATAP